MENEGEVLTQVLPIDHESNRLGFVILERWEGKIYHYTDKELKHGNYFAWPSDERRGYQHKSLEDAADSIDIKKPTGYADYFGKVRAGKLIEKHSTGEIWKDQSCYYAWYNNEYATRFDTLARARTNLNVRIVPPSIKTAPKSSYAQNQKGYRPGGVVKKQK